MVTVERKVNCEWIAEFKTVTAVGRRLTAHNREDMPHTNPINDLIKTFKETGSVKDKPRSRRPRLCEDTLTAIQQAFERQPQELVRRESAERNIP
jgi:hypothetical protein